MPNTVYVNFHGPITELSSRNLMTLCESAIRSAPQADHIYIILSSTGGTVYSGIAVYNFIKALPVKVTTHNVSRVDSIANVVFLAGDERFAAPNASFLFHGAT